MKIEDLPRPANYRRQMAKNGGYEMLPAYTAEEVLGILEGVNRDADAIKKALDRAFIMGQNYWHDADSESYAANKRSDVTRHKFNEMRDELCAAIKKGQV